MIFIVPSLKNTADSSDLMALTRSGSNLVVGTEYDKDFSFKRSLLGGISRDDILKENQTTWQDKKGLLTIYDLIQHSENFQREPMHVRHIDGIDLSKVIVKFITPGKYVLVKDSQIKAVVGVKTGTVGTVDSITWLNQKQKPYQLDEYSNRGFLSRRTYYDHFGLRYLEEYLSPKQKVVLRVSFNQVVSSDTQTRSSVASGFDWIGHQFYSNFLAFLKATCDFYLKEHSVTVRAEDISIIPLFKGYSKVHVLVSNPLSVNVVNPQVATLTQQGAFLYSNPKLPLVVPNSSYAETLSKLFKNKITVESPNARKPSASFKNVTSEINGVMVQYSFDESIWDGIQAWQKSLIASPNILGNLDIFGLINTNLKKRLEDYLAEQGLSQKIKLHDYVFDVNTVYAQAKIYLQTQIHDLTGYASQEAKAFGLTTIGFKTPFSVYDRTAFDSLDMASEIVKVAVYTTSKGI